MIGLPDGHASIRSGKGYRVSILSLLRPSRVDVAGLDRPLKLSVGGKLAASLSVELAGRGLSVGTGFGLKSTPARSVTIGEAGARLRVTVTGKDSRSRELPGPVEITRTGEVLRVVATMSLEELVAAGVANEMAHSSQIEALEALAVVVRSYILTQAGRHRADGFDLCDTTHCFVSRGSLDTSNAHQELARRAAQSTFGLVLKRERRVVCGYITACCGGATTTPALIWGTRDTGDFVPVECQWCKASDYYRWERDIAAPDLTPVLERLMMHRFSGEPSLDVTADASGWVRWVAIRDGTRERRVRGDVFRMTTERKLGWDTVPSPRFQIERTRSGYRFRGGGFGHGIGFCLDGAVAQAAAGRTRSQILTGYFPRATVGRLPD